MEVYIVDLENVRRVDQKLSEIVELLMQMDQKIAAETARNTAGYLIALLADIGALNPNQSITAAAMEHINHIELEVATLRRQLEDCAGGPQIGA